ncbi:MAG: MlaD family protein, partial [Bacteroidota bacterium]
MEKKTIDNIKLGTFVSAGLLFLVVLLYMIGKNMSLFGDTYMLKARFENAQGLVVGNNVRYSGIQSGTVKEIEIMNDTTIEVTLLVEKKMMAIIRKNAVVSIGTEGLVGNKVVNIIPRRKQAPLAEEGDILFAKRSVDADEMLQTLSQTNNDVAVIAADLKITIQRINTSNALWNLLNDK